MANQISADRKTVAFQSQEDWLRWVNDTRAADLKHVRTLALRLVNVELTGLLASNTASASDRGSGPPSSIAVYQLYQNKLTELDRGLAAMPSLSQIRIIPPSDSESHLLRGLYISLLQLIPRRYPRLRRLELVDNDVVLQRVPELRTLPDVVCMAPPRPPPPPTASNSDSNNVAQAARQYKPGDSSSSRPGRTYARNVD